MQHSKYSTTWVKSLYTFLIPVAPQEYEKLELCVSAGVSAWSFCSVSCGQCWASGVSCYYFPHSSLFIADSWIICAYALLLDDSWAVGLQAVFQNRWIMNKPLQQKSCVLHEPGLRASIPTLLCQPLGKGGVGREGQVSRNGGAIKCFCCRIFIPLIGWC